jgi:hypothetical protein
MNMSYLKSTQYIFSLIAIALLTLMRPAGVATTEIMVCAICASLMIGRGLIQMNTGGAGSSWRSAEFQFLLIGYAWSAYAWLSVLPEERLLVAIAMVSLQAVFNLARGMAEHYRAENPLILR